MGETGGEGERKYIAFISYAHVDSAWAHWLHRSLEHYRLPSELRQERAGRARIGRVFLDRSELASSADLSGRIQEALDQSANLLIVCSPASARSRWVNEEVRRFRATGKGERIFCLLVGGDPGAGGEHVPFPPTLLEPINVHTAPIEPLAADVRPNGDGRRDAKLKIISGLLNVPLDALRRREQARRHRRLAIVAAASVVLMVLMSALAVSAILARREAEQQEQTARRTADFLRDLFDAASPERTGASKSRYVP